MAPQTDRPPRPGRLHTTEPTFAELVVAHQRMVWRYLRLLGADPHEADDLMQDSFVVLGQRLQRGERPDTAAGFLRGTARNLLIGARRRSQRQPPTFAWADAVDHIASGHLALDDHRIDALRQCLEQLSGRARDAVHWHHIDGLSRADTAARLGLGDEGTKSLLARTRQTLRDCIQRRLRAASVAADKATGFCITPQGNE